MSEADALLRRILDDPADDTVRLVYADKLDESGKAWDAARAELIRLQVRRIGAPVAAVTQSLRREEQILKKWGAKWLPPLARLDRSLFGWQVHGDCVSFSMERFHARYVFERGFPASVLLESHAGPGFDTLALGAFVRQALSHRPVETFELRLTGHTPALTLQVAPYRASERWRAVLTEDGDERAGVVEEYITSNRKTMVAGLPKWVALVVGEFEFERVTDYRDDEFDIPF